MKSDIHTPSPLLAVELLLITQRMLDGRPGIEILKKMNGEVES